MFEDPRRDLQQARIDHSATRRILEVDSEFLPLSTDQSDESQIFFLFPRVMCLERREGKKDLFSLVLYRREEGGNERHILTK